MRDASDKIDLVTAAMEQTSNNDELNACTIKLNHKFLVRDDPD